MGEKKKDRSSYCHWPFKTAVGCFNCPSSTSYNLNKNIRLLKLVLKHDDKLQEVFSHVKYFTESVPKIKKLLLKIKNSDRINKNT